MSVATVDPQDDWQPKRVEDELTAIRFQSRDMTLVGHLYLPQAVFDKPPPVIVLCWGLGLTQDAGFDGVRSGLLQQCQVAVFTFDYATFGESAGFPRHQVKPTAHVDDIMAAIHCMEHHEKVDGKRIGLWGSSLGGGHVLAAAAAKNPNIRAVVGWVPHTRSAFESVLGTIARQPAISLVGVMKLVGVMVRWILASLCFGSTTYVPLHGPPGSTAMMQNPGDDAGYSSVAPTQKIHWRNAATAGSVLSVLLYRPINVVRSIVAPVLLIPAEHDTLCPAAGARRAAAMIRNGSLLELKGASHFDIYDGVVFNKAMEATARFFTKYLVQNV